MAEDIAGQMPAGYASREPYPEIKAQKHNRTYAALLTEDYSGNVSETTATMQYIYHEFVFKNKYKELALLLENIAKVEMLHIEVLADAIIALGGNPAFKSGKNRKYWNAEMVNYGKDLCDRLKTDLHSENMAIRNYREHIGLIEDPYIRALLNRIIKDEEVHVILFKEALAKYCKEKEH